MALVFSGPGLVFWGFRKCVDWSWSQSSHFGPKDQTRLDFQALKGIATLADFLKDSDAFTFTGVKYMPKELPSFHNEPEPRGYQEFKLWPEVGGGGLRELKNI